MYKVKVFTVNGNTHFKQEYHAFNQALNDYHRLVGRYVVEGTDTDWPDAEDDNDHVPSDHAAKVTFTYPTGLAISHAFERN